MPIILIHSLNGRSKRGINFEDIERATTLEEFDRAYTAKYHNYRVRGQPIDKDVQIVSDVSLGCGAAGVDALFFFSMAAHAYEQLVTLPRQCITGTILVIGSNNPY